MKEAVFDFICRMTGGNKEVAELCAETVGTIKEGDVCLSLNDKQRLLLEGVKDVASFVEDAPPPASVRTPFVVAGGLLYTRRNWVYERRVRDWVAGRVADKRTDEVAKLPDDPFYAKLNDEQRAAVTAMCNAKFSILTGGPGTGKTYTIARAVKFVHDLCPGLRLGLAAPTGKAKARMNDSLGQALKGERIDVAPATTIHSLLGPNQNFVTFRHNRVNPLSLDWLIVDEASMIDLPLMAKLLDALPDECRLTLVGDADQLASVERGRVFGDLCLFPGVSVSRLWKSTRFESDGDIAKLSAAVNGNDADGTLAILRGRSDAVSYFDLSGLPREDIFDPAKWPEFKKRIQDGFKDFAESKTVKDALAHLNDFRVLCAQRHGPFGSEQIARWIKKTLDRKCPIPIMVTRNDRGLEIENGDVGVVLPDNRNILHLSETKTVRLELLPNPELAFASTVHKAQGSQFTDVAIVLPPNPSKKKARTDDKGEAEGEAEADSFKLLTREILYTAITRTEKTVAIWGSEDAIRHCAEHATERVSGLVP